MLIVRYGIGAVMVLGGLVMLLISPSGLGVEGFAMAVGGGLSVLLINFLFRLGVEGDRERQQEERARVTTSTSTACGPTRTISRRGGHGCCRPVSRRTSRSRRSAGAGRSRLPGMDHRTLGRAGVKVSPPCLKYADDH